MFKKLIAPILILLSFTACTPAEVDQWFDDVIGHDISKEEAIDIANWINSQDCLPGYDREQYTECAIKDMAERFGLPVSSFASLSWCESRITVDAENPHSSASGLFQFLDSTWNYTASQTGHWDVYNARQHAFNAAWLWVNHGRGQWSC